MMNKPIRDSGGARTLPGRYFQDPRIFDREMERIFRRHWLCAGRASELAEVGDFLVVEVAGESLLLVRGDDRQLRCFHNVCRHRGTRVCETSASSGASSGARAFRCPYHAWTYDLRGRLVAAPNMSDVPGFQVGEYPLKQAAVGSWQGFLWVHLDQSPGELAEWFAPLDELLRPWGLEELVTARRLEYDIAANWKLLFQNYNECYHCPWVHPALNSLTPYKSAGNDLQEGPFLGGPMSLAAEAESMTLGGRACAAPLPGLDARQRRQVAYYTLFPTVFLSPHPDFVLVHRVEPRGVGRTRVVCEFLFHPEATAVPGFDPTPAVEFWDQTNRQDWHVCELSHAGIGSSAYEPGPYSHLESVLAAFDRHYLTTLDREFTD